jgi:hypothetical protein
LANVDRREGRRLIDIEPENVGGNERFRRESLIDSIEAATLSATEHPTPWTEAHKLSYRHDLLM